MNGSETLRRSRLGLPAVASGRGRRARGLRAPARRRRGAPADPLAPAWPRPCAPGRSCACPSTTTCLARLQAPCETMRRLALRSASTVMGRSSTVASALDDVGERALRPVLDDGRRDRRCASLRVDEVQARLHELVGPEQALRVVEDRLEADRRRGLVDLVVDDGELALAERLVAVAAAAPRPASVAVGHAPRRSRGRSSSRQREEDRDGVELRDDDEAGRVGRRARCCPGRRGARRSRRRWAT